MGVVRLLNIRSMLRFVAFTVLMSLGVVGCTGEGIRTERKDMPDGADGPMQHDRPGDIATGRDSYSGGIFGEGGLFGDSTSGNSGGGGIGVNSYLWRASLDTISFMPITSADPFGGVIITDWHASSESPNERFKLNVFILGRELRADGVRVAVFRQVLNNQNWQDVSLPPGIGTKIEDAVLMRARQLRLQTLGQE